MHPRIQELLDAGRLIHQQSPDAQVAGLWCDGMGAYAYACSPEGPPARRLVAVHDTARMASLALLRAFNLRERTKGDRETALTAAGFLGGDRLSALLREIQGGRSARDREAPFSADDIEALMPSAREMLMLARDKIIGMRLALADELEPISDETSDSLR